MSSRHLLLQPRWVVAHLVILTVVVTFPMLGAWQLDRWDEQRALQARLQERRGAEPVPIASVLDEDTPPDRIADLEFRPVTATGRYAADEEVAHRNRAMGGRSGFDWLTPLVLDGDRAVLVRRGFVPPTQAAGVDPTPAPPPDGEVTVTGWLELSGAQPTGIGARDPDTGTIDTVFHADVDRIDQQTSSDLLPMILHLGTQEPAPDGDLPIPQPLPSDDDGAQNLSYAVQWFSFTAIALVGYGIVLRRKLRDARDDTHAEHAASGTSPREAR